MVTASLQPSTRPKRGGVLGTIDWYLEWALPGLGMFSEAYIVFAAGQIGPFTKTMWPTCYSTYADCEENLVKHVADYITICGIIAGMLFWGVFADYTGRKWGSISVAAIMLSGCILLTFFPFTTAGPHQFLSFFLVAQTWYGFGVGGEYPLASSSAAERAEMNPELRHARGQQVILVFSNQGMGNFVNASVIAIAMAIFAQTGPAASLTFEGSRNVLVLMYGVGAFMCLVMVLYRFVFLKESKMFDEVHHIVNPKAAVGLRKHLIDNYYFWPRRLVASAAWIANDFAFYGNKLQQGRFISLLYPTATPFKKQQWTILNSFIALTGYWLAAALVDKPWYGRVRMQYIGFILMFVFFIIIYGQWENMGAPGAAVAGVHAFQAMYYLSSFFNQFGPNATTWLVAGEIFPTDVRASYHGVSAAMGKVGAIIASLWISYIADQRKVFLVSAIWGLAGAAVTWLFLPDTTGLDLNEYDRMHRYMLEGRFKDYHGPAVARNHLSIWEIYVCGWHKQYDKELDRLALVDEQFAEQAAKDTAAKNMELTEAGGKGTVVRAE